MTWTTLPPAGPDVDEVTDALERWSRRNELDALATLQDDTIVVQGAGGTEFARFDSYDEFTIWCSQIDACLIPWPIEED